MLLRAKKNRRRIDVKATVRSHAPFALKLFVAAVAIIGVGFGGQKAWRWAQTSDRFGLEHVNVRGAEHASDSELLKLTGLQLGQNMLQLDVPAIERAFGSHPWVRTANVRRRFPGNLEVTLTEHRAVAVASLGELYLVDTEGQPFKRLQAQDDLDLPLITGLDRDAYVADPAFSIDRIRAALALINLWKGKPLAEVRTSDFGLTIVTNEGQEIRLGDAPFELKLARLERLNKELSTRKQSADLIRLDNRMRPDWVTVQLSTSNRTK